MQMNFISSKDLEETRTMHTKSGNIEIMMDKEADEIIKKLFGSLLQKHQERLEESMRGSKFIRDGFDLLYYHLKKKFEKRRIIYRFSGMVKR